MNAQRQARRWYASSRPGARKYHSFENCIGLNSTYAKGDDSIVALTATQVVDRRLEPCGTCKPSGLLRVVPPA